MRTVFWRLRGPGLLALGLAGANGALARAPAAPTVNQNFPPGYDPQTGKRSYSQHAFTRVRPGSMLHSDAPPPEIPDLRSDWERRRDGELMKHYARMAQLDIIADVAEKAHSISLQEKTEEVRRKEIQRFHDAMQDLHQVSWRRVVAEAP